MTIVEMEKQINRLIDTFGKTYYSDERRKQIWLEFNGLTEEMMARAVTDLISEKRQAPLIMEIREAVSKVRDSDWYRTKRISVRNVSDWGDACIQCKGNGAILARHKNDGSPFAFKCNCSIGREDSRLFPMWSDSLREEYSLI